MYVWELKSARGDSHCAGQRVGGGAAHDTPLIAGAGQPFVCIPGAVVRNRPQSTRHQNCRRGRQCSSQQEASMIG